MKYPQVVWVANWQGDNIVAGSAKLGVNIQNSMGGYSMISLMLQDCIFPVALVFNVDEVSISLNTDNPVSGSPLLIPFSRLFILEVHTITILKSWLVSC